MNKIFPDMYSKPEKIQFFSLIPAWIWVFVMAPMYMPFLGLGLWDQWEISVWLEIGYHVVNGIILLLLMLSYLKEEWFMVRTDVRFYLKHVLLTVGLIIVAELVWMINFSFFGFDISYMLQHLPVAEKHVVHTPLSMIGFEPIFGAITLSAFTPISVCALFYCFGFAPVCCRKTWLAYLSVALITLIPPIIDILWRGEIILALSSYLAPLPIHLLACWSYQKTDNVWTPLISLAIVNLLMSIAMPLILFA